MKLGEALCIADQGSAVIRALTELGVCDGASIECLTLMQTGGRAIVWPSWFWGISGGGAVSDGALLVA